MEPRAGNGAGRQAERGETNPARLECQRRRWNGDGAIEIAQLSPSTMYLHTYGCARTSMCVQAGGREGLRRCLSMLLFCGFGLELGWAGLSWASGDSTHPLGSVAAAICVDRGIFMARQCQRRRRGSRSEARNSSRDSLHT